MNTSKEKNSLDDVEQLLRELALHDRQKARQEAQTKLMCDVVSQEISRVFFRRCCFKVAGSVSALCVMGLTLSLLLTEENEVSSAPGLASTTRPTIVRQLSVQDLKNNVPDDFHADAHINYESRVGVQFQVGCIGGYDIEVLPIPL